jgi:hypothetical protein
VDILLCQSTANIRGAVWLWNIEAAYKWERHVVGRVTFLQRPAKYCACNYVYFTCTERRSSRNTVYLCSSLTENTLYFRYIHRLTPFTEIMFVIYFSHTQHKNTLCERSAEFLVFNFAVRKISTRL